VNQGFAGKFSSLGYKFNRGLSFGLVLFAMVIVSACQNPLSGEKGGADATWSPGFSAPLTAGTSYSTISGSGPVIANGTSTSTITIILRDSSMTPIVATIPTFSVTGSNNTTTACSASDTTGTSTCTLASTTAETKTLSISFPTGLSAVTGTVVFSPATTTPTLAAIATHYIPKDPSTSFPVVLSIDEGTGAETAETVSCSATSSNVAVIANAGLNCVSYDDGVADASTAGARLFITPVAGQTGTSTITVTVNDGTFTANRTFTADVRTGPTSLAGLRMWLRADSMITADAATVTSWADQSTIGNNATAVSAPTYRTSIINSRPVVRLNGTSDYFTLPNFISGSTSGEVFFIRKNALDPPTNPFASGIWNFTTDATGSQNAVVPYSDGVAYDGWGSDTRKTLGNPTPSLSSAHLYHVRSAANDWRATINGKQLFATTTNTVGFPAAPTLGKSNTAYFYEGDIAEFLVFNATLAAADRYAIQTYLSLKYGLDVAPRASKTSATLVKNSANTVTLTYEDGNSDSATACAISGVTGGAAGACSCAAGTCTFTFTPTTGLGGTDVSTFAYTITANGQVSDLSTVGVTVTNNAPTISSIPSNRVYPLDVGSGPARQGEALSLRVVAADVDSAETLTFSCAYETLDLSTSDPNYAGSGTNCKTLPTLRTVSSVVQRDYAQFDTATGTLAWTPTNTQLGTYKFTVTVADTNTSVAASAFYVTVAPDLSTSKLLGAYDAYASDVHASTGTAPVIPRLDGTATDAINNAWYSLIGATNGTLSGFFATVAPWIGLGTSTSPYRLVFNGTADRMSLGTLLTGQTKVAFSTWIAPSDTAATGMGDVILTNGGNVGNGMQLQMSDTQTGKIELVIGKKSYSQTILNDSPIRYWRLNETVGTTATDSSVTAAHGTYSGSGVTYNQTGALTNDTAGSALFDGVTGTMTPPVQVVFANSAAFTLEAWYKGTDTAANGNWGQGLLSFDNNGLFTGLVLRNGYVEYIHHVGAWQHNIISATLVADGNWHHIVYTSLGGETGSLYIDGTAEVSAATSATDGGVRNYVFSGLMRNYNGVYTSGSLQEAAIYNYALSAAQAKAHYDAGQGIFYPNPVLAAQPKSYWRLNERGGGVAQDMSTNSMPGTYSASGITYEVTGALAGETDKGITVDAVAGKVTVAHNAIYNSYPLSVSAWVKFTGVTNNRGIASKYVAASMNGWQIHTENGNLCAWYFKDGANYVYDGTACPMSVAGKNDGAWHHVAFTVDSTGGKFYVDGALGTSQAWTGTAGATTSAQEISLGYYSGGTYLDGSLDEVAIFDYALTPAQVSQMHSSGHFWKCLSRTRLTNGLWAQVSGLWDGTNLEMYVNGQRECLVAPGTTYSPPATNLIAGATSTSTKWWSGLMNSLRVFGTSDGSAASTTSLLQTEFTITANRVRASPVTDIVTSNLVLHLDPANANRSLAAAYTNGCATSDLNWYDISTSGYVGQLRNISACGATKGWNGNGTSQNPYRLDFNATPWASLGDIELTNSNRQTLCAWFKTTTLTQYVALIDKGYTSAGYFLGGDYAGNTHKLFYYTGGTPGSGVASDSAVNDGLWHFGCGVYDGTLGVANVKLYIDGVQQATTANLVANIPNIVEPLGIGAQITPAGNGGFGLNGSLGPVLIYNSPLTANEVMQNYRALVGRFSSVSAISGLKLWLDASVGVTYDASSLVSQWNDQSGNALHVSQAVAASKPLYVNAAIGGKPAIRFDGGNDLLVRTAVLGSNLVANNEGTIFLVVRQDASKVENTPFAWAHASGIRLNAHFTWANVFYLDFGNFAAGGRISGAQPSTWDDQPHIVQVYRDTGNAGLVKVDSTTVASGVFTSTFDGTLTSDFFIGGFGGSYGFKGDIAEMIIYNRGLTTTERSGIEAYLGSKYGIALP